MKNKKNLKQLALSMLLTSVIPFSLAHAGTGSTGGGSFAEQDFAKSGWLKFYRMQRMDVANQDLEVLEAVLNKTKVIETTKTLNFQGQEKNALNIKDGEVPCEYIYCQDPKQKIMKFHQPVILFSSDAWKGAPSSKKSDFAIHEYLGILASDRNNYEISARLSALCDEVNQARVLPSSTQLAGIEAVEHFLEVGNQKLDEINAHLAVGQNGEALKKAEALKSQVLNKLGVSPVTGQRSPNLKLNVSIEDMSRSENVLKYGADGYSKYIYTIISHSVRMIQENSEIINTEFRLRDPKEDAEALGKYKVVRSAAQSSESMNSVVDLIGFNKLVAIALHKAYTRKIGRDDLKSYMIWAMNFAVLISDRDSSNIYVGQEELVNMDYFKYIHIEFFKETGIKFEPKSMYDFNTANDTTRAKFPQVSIQN